MRNNTNLENNNKNKQKTIDKIYLNKKRLNHRAGSVTVIALISVVIAAVAVVSISTLLPIGNNRSTHTERTTITAETAAPTTVTTATTTTMTTTEKAAMAESSTTSTAAAVITTPETVKPSTTAAPTTTKPTTAAPTTTKPTTTAPTTTKPTTTAPTTTKPTTTAPTTTAASPTKDAATTAPDQPAYAQEIQALLDGVNEHRANIDQPVAGLTLATGKAAEAAAIRAQEISIKFDHKRPDGSSPFDLLKQLGVSYRSAGENIAMAPSSYDSDDILQMWLDSKGHRENIENAAFSSMAVGIYEIDGYRYWVQLFLD